MKINVKRTTFTPVSTVGVLSIDGAQECFTLEDTVRLPGVKVHGSTAIPAGTYTVVVNMSNRFKTRLPLLLAVPNYEGVRIHPGNTDKDTEGCILVGTSSGKDCVNSSRKAFAPLLQKIEAAFAAGERITLTIG